MTGTDWPIGGGALGELIRRFDWSKSSLGPIAAWPQSLRTSVDIALASSVAIVMLWGPDGVMIYNDAYSVFASKRHPDLLGSKVLEGWPEVADFNRRVLDAGLSGKTLAFRDQQLVLFRNGVSEDVWMNLDYSPIRDEGGRPAAVFAVVVETTARVKAEAELRAVNAELAERVREREAWIEQKDELLREVNHRVKNSLQLVSSVLSMQSRQVTEAAAKAQFAAASARVTAITSVHELLYKEDAPLSIPIGSYIKDLCRELAHSVGGGRISVSVAADEFDLPTDQAVPVALIVNELVTNAMTHGSPDGGVVRVGFNAEGANLILKVDDSGPGMPDGAPTAARLGLRLIHALLLQIKGTLRHERLEPGYRVVLQIPRAG